jgi:hypothetical protein
MLSKYVELQEAAAAEHRGGAEWGELEARLRNGWEQAVADAAFAKDEAAKLCVQAQEAEVRIPSVSCKRALYFLKETGCSHTHTSGSRCAP